MRFIGYLLTLLIGFVIAVIAVVIGNTICVSLTSNSLSGNKGNEKRPDTGATTKQIS